MASTKFATLLRKNTHKMVVVLIYALLEWIMIVFLVLNSLLSYLTFKFAFFFGLRPPCLFCSRLERLFDPSKGRDSYRDLLCPEHVRELSPSCRGRIGENRSSSGVLGWAQKEEVGGLEEKGFGVVEKLDYDERDQFRGCEPEDRFVPMEFIDSVTLMNRSSSALEGRDCEVREKCEGVVDPFSDLVVVFGDEKSLDRPVENDGRISFSDEMPKPMEEAMVGEMQTEEEIQAYQDYSTNCDEANTEVSIGSEICDNEKIDHPQDIVAPAVAQFDYLKDFHDEIEGEAHEFEDGYMTNGKANYEFIIGRGICHPEHIPPLVGNNSYCIKHTEDGSHGNNDMMDVEATDALSVSDKCTNKKTSSPFVCHVDNSTETDDIEESEESTTLSSEASKSNISDAHFLLALVWSLCMLNGSLPSEDESRSDGEDAHDVPVSTDAHDMENINFPNGQVDHYSETHREIGNNAIGTCKADGQTTCGISNETYYQEHIAIVQHEEQLTVSSGQSHDSEKDYRKNEHEAQDYDKNGKPEKSSYKDTVRSELYNDQEIDQFRCQNSRSISMNHLEVPAHIQDVATDVCQGSRTEQSEITDTIEHQPSLSSPEHDEMEDDRVPDTPTSVEGLYNLHRRYMFGSNEPGTESIDGSTTSEIDVDGVSTVEKLRSALKAERKALSALYAELEEERNASAIAANQTMAMITRLQEEKAAMQMEALQYQRMMEEQTEYDQEAVHLLNDLTVKKDKEKQELERELEVYRKKLLLYEARERRTQSANLTKRSDISPGSTSADDSDDASAEPKKHDDVIDCFSKSNDSIYGFGMSEDSGMHLGILNESLADFEEERISILEQLRVLEEKLFAVDDEEHNEEIVHLENGNIPKEKDHMHGEDEQHQNNTINGFANGSSHEKFTQEEHRCGRKLSSNGKRLLPVFNAAADDEDGMLEEHEVSHDLSSKITSVRKKDAFLEEMDHVYERLQALETDREFLKHSIRSLKKGDKGMELLQEILRHLRDLRNVELQIRDSSDDLNSFSF